MESNSIQKNGLHLGYVISPHGFGHAARASAVMNAVYRLNPKVVFDIVTTVPEWFFQDSLIGSYSYLYFESDIGVVQVSPFEEDLPGTIERLKSFLPFQGQRSEFLGCYLENKGCSLVICDISPLGIQAAHQAGIPAVLVENFTWEWIYAGYQTLEPRFAGFEKEFQRVFHSAEIHIQTTPVCEEGQADLRVDPVGREPKHSREVVRAQLSIQDKLPMVLITMGGSKRPTGQYRASRIIRMRSSSFQVEPRNSNDAITWF